MNNWKMLLEEILPFYFLFTLIAIMFVGHNPATFETYIVYMFAFCVALYNNKLYRDNKKLENWGYNTLDVVMELEKENAKLRKKIKAKGGNLEDEMGKKKTL